MRVVLCALVLLLAGAASAAEEEATPIRVATLLPWIEDALAQVPEHAIVVATVRRDLHTPVAGGAIDLGNPHSPSFERLAQARPDLVVADATLHAPLRAKLAIGETEVLLIPTSSVTGTLEGLVEVGRRVGAEAELTQAAASVRRALDGLALEDPVPTLALFGAPGSFFAVTERAWLGDLLARLNFENVSRGDPTRERFPGLVPLNDELVATLRPRVVLLVTHGDPERIQEAFRSRVTRGGPWQSMHESASGGIHVLSPRFFATNPGLALPAAARRLVEIARPAVSAGPP